MIKHVNVLHETPYVIIKWKCWNIQDVDRRLWLLIRLVDVSIQRLHLCLIWFAELNGDIQCRLS